jgi:7-cyano-7-deazaguanine synthase
MSPRRIVFHTPLMGIGKAATWRLAEQLGGGALVDLMRTETHSCYGGDRKRAHLWGHGCGTCDACRLRAGGWMRYTEARELAEGRAGMVR